MKIIALGTGANGGIPEIYCNCRVCNVAREDPKEARFRSSIAVELESGKFLIVDASPDLRLQLIRNKIEIKSINAMLLTHAHYDHIGGLFEFYLVGYLDIDIYSHPGVLDCFSRQLIRNGDSKKTYDLRFHNQYRKLEFDQTLITGFEVPHTSSTYGPTLGLNHLVRLFVPATFLLNVQGIFCPFLSLLLYHL